MRVHHATLTNKPDHPVFQRMKQDAHDHGWTSFLVIGQDQPDMQIGYEKGFGMKVILFRKELDKLPPEDVVLFTDAHDVRVLATPEQVKQKFLHMHTRIVISAERNCYPHPEAAALYTTHRNPSATYKYVNSGAIIGYVGSLCQIIDTWIRHVEVAANDQSIWTGMYLKHQHDSSYIRLDTQAEIFQSLYLSHRDLDPSTLQNRMTGTYPLVWHGNGGNQEGDVFLMSVVLRKQHVKPEMATSSGKLEHLAKEAMDAEKALDMGRAEQCWRQCIDIDPSYFLSYTHLCRFYHISDLWPAIEELLMAIFDKPTHTNLQEAPKLDFHVQMQICRMMRPIYKQRSQIQKMLAMYQSVWAHIMRTDIRTHEQVEVCIELAVCYVDLGRIKEAMAVLQEGLAILGRQGGGKIWDAITFVEQYMRRYDMVPQVKTGAGVLDRKNVRIGIVSKRLYNTPYKPFILALFQKARAAQFHIECFYDYDVYDDFTRTLMPYVQGWHPIHDKNEQDVSSTIHKLQLDLIVHLDSYNPVHSRSSLWKHSLPMLTYVSGHAPPALSGVLPFPGGVDIAISKWENCEKGLSVGLLWDGNGCHSEHIVQMFLAILQERQDITLYVQLGKGETCKEQYAILPKDRVIFVPYVDAIQVASHMDLVIDGHPIGDFCSVYTAVMSGTPVATLHPQSYHEYAWNTQLERLPSMEALHERVLHLQPPKKTPLVMQQGVDTDLFVSTIVSMVTKETTTVVPITTPSPTANPTRIMLIGVDTSLHSYLVQQGCHVCNTILEQPDVILDLTPTITINATLNTHDIPVITFFQKTLLPDISHVYSACKTGRLRLMTSAEHREAKEVLEQVRLSYTPIHKMDDIHRVVSLPNTTWGISGETIMHHLCLKYKNITRVLPTHIEVSLNTTDIYMINTDKVREFLSQLRKSRRPFIILSNNSDLNVEDNTWSKEILANPRLVGWFAQNCAIYHPKLRHLPIGIANSGWPHGDMYSLARAKKKASNVAKRNLCYVGCDVKTNTAERLAVKQMSMHYGWQDQHRKYEEYLEHLSTFRCGLCPAGAGLDTHRMWECLYMGVIPVLRDMGHWTSYWRERIPCIVVSSWSEATPEFLTNALNKLVYPMDWERWTDARTYIQAVDDMVLL